MAINPLANLTDQELAARGLNLQGKPLNPAVPTAASALGGSPAPLGTQRQGGFTAFPQAPQAPQAAPNYNPPTGTGKTMTLSQGGQTKQIDVGDMGQINSLINQGWTPLNDSGQPLNVVNYGGGKMTQDPVSGQWQPLSVTLGAQWDPAATAAMPAFNQWMSKTGGQQPGPSGLIGNENNPNLPLIPNINLGPTPQIASSLQNAGGAPGTPGNVLSQVSDLTGQVTGAIGGQYDLAQKNMPQAQAAQTALGQVPQTSATQIQISPEVQRMLSGTLGYDPSILAKMKANAVDSTAAMGGSELAAANRAAEQAGLGGGGTSQANAQDIARQTGQASTQAQNAIDVGNAQLAQQNFQSGVGYQQSALQDNFQMANQMALENANKLFQSIQQNTANTQQANLTNAAAGQRMTEEGAQQKAAFDASQGNMYNSANVQQAMNALTGNTQNAINQNLNQAQLDRNQAATNLGSQQNQWQAANTLAMGMSPVNQFNPQPMTSPIGATLQNVGAGLLNQGTKNTLGTP